MRYSSPQTGRHAWTTDCSDQTNTGLHGVSGEVTVEPYVGDNPFYRHGFVRITADKRRFEHADGTPFFWLGDTWWMGLTKRLPWPDGFKTLAADRTAKGFNVIQIVAGLYPDMPAFDERGANEAGFPWESDYARINPAYFDAADRRIASLADQGLAPCIVGAWGYHLPWVGVPKMKQHWRYLVARYGAYPTFWCVAGEGAMPYYLSTARDDDAQFQKQGWTEVAAYLRSIDPQRHPVTIHPSDRSRNQVVDPAVLDFEMLQTGHGDRASIPGTLAAVAASRAAQPTMPTLNSEVCYEGILGTCPADVVRFMTWSCLLSGTAGHTYGANGIWQVNEPGRPYGKSPHGGNYGNTPWDEAMALAGSGQSGIARRLLEPLGWHDFEVHPEWARYQPDVSLPDPVWGQWIWYPEGEPTVSAPVARRWFRKTFDLPESSTVTAASLWLAVDNRCEARINGVPVGTRQGWGTPFAIDVKQALRPGRNVLTVEAENLPAPVADNPAGLMLGLNVTTSDGQEQVVQSDESWHCSQSQSGQDTAWTAADYDDSTWNRVKILGPHGRGPWGTIAASPGYGPFAAGISGKVRVIYIPEPRRIDVLELDPGSQYNAQAFDPVSGETTDLGAATPDARGAWSPVRPAVSGQSDDWILILKRQPPRS